MSAHLRSWIVVSVGLVVACAEGEPPSPAQSVALATTATTAQDGAGAADRSAGEQPGAFSGRFDDAFVGRVQAEAEAALAAGAGITLRQPVPAVLLTAAEARERREAFARELPEHAGVTAALDLVVDFAFAEGMLGRYLPDEKVLYVIEEVLEREAGGNRSRAEDVLFGVLAHELVHAYDDQTYAAVPLPSALIELAADGKRLPEMQAQMSLLEGHAVYAAELASAAAGRQPLDAFTLEEVRNTNVFEPDGDGTARDIGVGLVNVIARTKLVQYAFGREFCKAAHDFGGERFVGQVFTHLPLSLAELEDFELFKQRWARQMEAAMEAEDDPAGETPPAAPATPVIPDQERSE